MESIELKPIRFLPYLKNVIWGGDKICSYKKIRQDQPNIGESWEISVVPGFESIVSEGRYKGKSLPSLIERFGEGLLGAKVMEKYGPRFPLLIKFIDARDNLSVQVHPDDKLAFKRHKSLGKTEMWYIINSEKGAKIWSGLKNELTPEDFEKQVSEGTFMDSVASHDSHEEDVFFLPAGRVHAIGAGNLLAEIQESSDITYRIYDYDRRDADGNPRELHVEQAKDAIDFTVYDDYKSPAPASEEEVSELVSCQHFSTKMLKINGERKFRLDGTSFRVLMCIKGRVDIITAGGILTLCQGQTVLLPASVEEVTFKGNAILLSTRC